MTTKYESKDHALMTGAYYAGYTNPEDQKTALENAEIGSRKLESPHEKTIEVYTFNNVNGDKSSVGVSEFRDGYDLWLIDDKTGFCERT